MKNFECCTTCLDIAMDAAYCDGFKTEDDEFEVIDSGFDGDAGDIVYPRHNSYDE